MTPKEMYIRIINDLSGLAAQRTRKFVPEQIELEMNAVVDDYILQAITENPRGFFTVDAEYYDVIQPLIQSHSVAVEKLAGKSVAYVPLDTHRLLDVQAFGGTQGNLGSSTISLSRYFYSIQITEPTTAPFYKSVEFKVGTSSIYKRTSTNGYSTADMHQLINELVSAVPGLAWESAFDSWYGGKLVYTSHTAQSPVLLVDGTTVLSTLEKSQPIVQTSIAKNNSISTRRIKNQMRSEVLSTPYYMPSVMDIPVLLSKNTLELHTPASVIVNSVLITAIRRPRKISLSLNIGCELDPGYHSKICDKTVQRIRERIGDPKYQTGSTL